MIDVGLFKLTLMELVGDGNSRQPTGRVVVFPNSIVFQTNGNFFKQAPGTNFVWNEFRLTLSPECDYRLAEKRLLEVVEDVYARYRDTVQRQYSDLERDLSMKFESPRPQSRLRLGPNGIELTIRYPADTRYAVQVADDIAPRARRDHAGSRALPVDARYAQPLAACTTAAAHRRGCGAQTTVRRARGPRRAAAERRRGSIRDGARGRRSDSSSIRPPNVPPRAAAASARTKADSTRDK